MANLGLLILAEGEAPVSAEYGRLLIALHIVFVHGLRGDRLKTWTKDGTVWPRDLLPQDLPNVRIISWGYDADVASFFENASRSSIFNHAHNLLEDLQLCRKTAGQKCRPIIFVAHSLGGLVVKDALHMSHDHKSRGYHPRLAAILTATVGIVFAGTPHRGSNKAAWASIATNLAKLILKDHNDRVINALCRGSETLERLQNSFSGIASDIKVFSFLEDEQTSGIGKIVDDDSASLGLPHERRLWLPANHSDMIKYHDRNDVSFVRVAGAISEIVEDLPESRITLSNMSQALTLPSLSDSQPQLAEASHARSSDNLQQIPPSCYAITVREHQHPDTRLLNYGKGEVVEDVHQLPGDYWQGKIGNKPHTTIRILKDIEPSRFEDLSENLSPADPSHKILPPNAKQNSSLSAVLTNEWLTEEAKRRNVFNEDPRELLIRAAEEGDEILAKISLSLKRISPDVKDALGIPVLLKAAQKGHKDVVELLIKSGATINIQNGDGETALHRAASEGHEAVVQVLAEKGAIIDKQAKYGLTALHFAAGKGHEAVVRVLVEKGAIVDKQTKEDDYTALHYAALKGHEAVVRVLAEKGAIVDKQTKYSETALHQAAFRGHEAVVRVLVEKGAIVDKQTKEDDYTALHYAAHWGYEAVVRVLIENRADVSLQTKHRQKAKHLAKDQGHKVIADILRNNGG